jgi:hypothetical protein
MKMHLTKNPRLWNGVLLGLIVALMLHLTVSSDAMRVDEPWPLLLPDNSASADPVISPLQQRANGALEKLVQSARESEQL